MLISNSWMNVRAVALHNTLPAQLLCTKPMNKSALIFGAVFPNNFGRSTQVGSALTITMSKNMMIKRWCD
jgi:hypothetical protein